ncbi:MAG: hypothetical protein U9O97_01755 [Elusimicrobiota bacterium]|nr:hypothetical protein [Elusimicrobiota bacterium]
MKRHILTICATGLLCAFAASSAHAGLTPGQVRKIYASTILEARDSYNTGRDMGFAEAVAVNGFFSTVFAEKTRKISSAKISFQPKMKGWTALVFKAVYSPDPGAALPAKITSGYKNFAGNIISAVNELGFDAGHSGNSVLGGFASAILFFAISILAIHKIKFRLFIQRE